MTVVNQLLFNNIIGILMTSLKTINHVSKPEGGGVDGGGSLK